MKELQATWVSVKNDLGVEQIKYNDQIITDEALEEKHKSLEKIYQSIKESLRYKDVEKAISKLYNFVHEPWFRYGGVGGFANNLLRKRDEVMRKMAKRDVQQKK